MRVQVRDRARQGGLAAEVLTLSTPGSLMGADSNPRGPASHPAPCLWPGKAVKDSPKPWNPVPPWETWKSSWLQFGTAEQ